MAIARGHKVNFDTLLRAAKNGYLALVECTDAKTGDIVIVLCATAPRGDGTVEISPFAKMFNGDPFEELIPPTAETSTYEG